MPGDPVTGDRLTGAPLTGDPESPDPKSSTRGPTLGIEEELFVADASTGRLVSRGREVQQATTVPPGAGAVVLELTLSQVETVTGVGTDVAEVVSDSARLRSAVAAGAARHGLALQASGTPVLGDAAEQLIAEDERYLALRTRAAGLVSQQLIAGMHVHVGVGPLGTDMTSVDDDARVAVADAIRPWLPALLALTANSPYWLGTDTGFASYRQVHWQRWPVAGPPPRTRDAVGWNRAVDELIATGVVDDASYVYWDVRLATRFPTVEVRVADIQPDSQDVRTYTALVRGLAAGALQQHASGAAGPDRVLDVPQHALRAAMWRAARYGLDEALVDPTTATLRPAHEVLDAMLATARPGLELTGDVAAVLEGLHRVESEGNGAQRQRAAFARAGWRGVLDVVRVAERAVVPDGLPAPVPDGNGWVDCACGNRHWGRNGAAGLLAVRPTDDGPQVLMQLRSPWTHQGGTWGLPGGARDSHESVSRTARREATEETGLDDAPLVDVAEHRVDHGTWSYTYVLAAAPAGSRAWVANRESDAVEWVPLDDVAGMPLHPALALEWPTLLDLVRRLPAPPADEQAVAGA